MRAFCHRLPWLLLALWPCVAGAAAGLRRNCLDNAAFAPQDRVNVTVAGISQPLLVGQATWVSGRILHWITRIVSEELLGINTARGYQYRSSAEAILVLWGCKHPGSINPNIATCGDSDYQAHVFSELWQTERVRLNVQVLTKSYPLLQPIDMGSVGYSGSESTYLQDRVVQQAFRETYLPLEYYTTYSNPTIRIADFFDSPWRIKVDKLTSCRHVGAFNGDNIRNYLAVTADRAGVVELPGTGVLMAKCVKDVWWISPACRSNLSECIPVITEGDGWFLPNIMQLVTAWSVPAAVALVRPEADYAQLARKHRMIFYSYWPGSDFTSSEAKAMVWPPHNYGDFSQGILTTAPGDIAIRRSFVAAAAFEQSSGFGKLAAVFQRMRINRKLMDELLLAASDHARTYDEDLQAVVCGWLNNNSDVVGAWLPSKTECVQGQGLVDATGAFVTALETATACRWCPTGRMSVREGGWSSSFGEWPNRPNARVPIRCRECSAGRYQQELGASACRNCPIGFFAKLPGSMDCARCPVGEYSDAEGMRSCLSCSPGFITSTLGATSADECMCPAGRYADPAIPGQCQTCMTGMECEEGSDMAGYEMAPTPRGRPVPLLLPGFWSSAEDPLSIFLCDNNIRCPGGRPGDACRPFLVKQACALCTDGYYWDGEECRVCVTRSSLAWGIPLLGTVLVIVVLYRLYGDPYEKWGSWQNGFSATCFIVLSHHQMLTVIRGCNLVLPRRLERALTFFEMTSLLGRLLLHPSCIGRAGFRVQIVAPFVGPLVVALLCVLTFSLSQCLGKLRPDIRMDKDRMINIFLSFLFTFFTGITEAAFTIFMCVRNPNGLSTLIRARNITCHEQEWKTFAVIGSVGVSVWVLGFSALLFRSIYVAPRRFHTREAQRRWKFLFIRYRPDVHWWATVVIAKDVILAVGISSFSSGVVQLIWICFLHIFYMFLLLLFRPWRHVLNNTADAVSKMILILNIAVFMALMEDRSRMGEESGEEAEVLALALIFMTFLPALPTLAGMIYLQHSQQVMARKEWNTELMLDSVQILLETQPVEVQAWIARLGERDFLLMTEFKDLVQTELGGRMCRPGYSPNRLTLLTTNHIQERRDRYHLTGKADSNPFLARSKSALSTHTALSRWSERSRLGAHTRLSLAGRSSDSPASANPSGGCAESMDTASSWRNHCVNLDSSSPRRIPCRGPRPAGCSATGEGECVPSRPDKAILMQPGPDAEAARGSFGADYGCMSGQRCPSMEGAKGVWEGGAARPPPRPQDAMQEDIDAFSQPLELPGDEADSPTGDGEGERSALSVILKDIEDSGALQRVRSMCNQVPPSSSLPSTLPYVQHAISQIGLTPPEQVHGIRQPSS